MSSPMMPGQPMPTSGAIRKAEDEADYREIETLRLVLARPDLSAPALAGHFFDAVKNVQGESVHDPFWRQEAIDLCTQAIRVIRIVNGVEPTLQSVYRAATSFESFERWVKQAQEAAAAARLKVRNRQATPAEHRLAEEVDLGRGVHRDEAGLLADDPVELEQQVLVRDAGHRDGPGRIRDEQPLRTQRPRHAVQRALTRRGSTGRDGRRPTRGTTGTSRLAP